MATLLAFLSFIFRPFTLSPFSPFTFSPLHPFTLHPLPRASPMTAPSRTGGQILVDQLLAQGVDHIFCVPGESYLAALDALHDAKIRVTVCRQEGGAAMMAEAYGKLTGRPGICFVTRGPGRHQRLARHSHRAAGFDADDPVRRPGRRAACASARPSRSSTTGRCSAPIAKWATEIDDPARIPRDRFARLPCGDAPAGRVRS